MIDILEGQIQLNAFRDFLGPAFQTQLEVNLVHLPNIVLWKILDLSIALVSCLNRLPSW